MSDLISLTDDDNTGSLNTTILQQVIANASGIVDMYCSNLYGEQIPFNPVPNSVANLALTIACYMLYERRETPFEQNKFGVRYKQAIAMLEKVNKGEMHFDDIPFRDFPQVAYTGRNSIYGGIGTNWPATSM